MYTGRIDLFAVPLVDGRAAGQRTYLFRVETGQAVWGMDFEWTGGVMGLLAVGDKNTRLLRVPAARLQALSQDEELGSQVVVLLDQWIQKLSGCLSETLPPKDCLNLNAGRETAISPQTHASAKRNVLWVEHLQGKSYFMGQPHFTVNGQGFTPISPHTWLKTIEDCRIQAQETAVFLTRDTDWTALNDFHQLFLHHIQQTIQQTIQADYNRLQNRILANQDVVNDALAQLAAPLTASDARPSVKREQNPIVQACQMVAGQLGITLIEPPASRLQNKIGDTLSEIARASRFQTRRVVLKGEWWHCDGGPFLGYWEESDQPVALLPKTAKSYEIHDPATGKKTAVTQEVTEKLAPFAFQFYRPFAQSDCIGLGHDEIWPIRTPKRTAHDSISGHYRKPFESGHSDSHWSNLQYNHSEWSLQPVNAVGSRFVCHCHHHCHVPNYTKCRCFAFTRKNGQ